MKENANTSVDEVYSFWRHFVFILIFVGTASFLCWVYWVYPRAELNTDAAAAWLTLAPGFAISMAGSYVAIKIAASAKKAQDAANEAQQRAIELDDPLTQRAANALLAHERLKVIKSIVKSSFKVVGNEARNKTAKKAEFDSYQQVLQSFNASLYASILETDLIQVIASGADDEIHRSKLYASVASILRYAAAGLGPVDEEVDVFVKHANHLYFDKNMEFLVDEFDKALQKKMDGERSDKAWAVKQILSPLAAGGR